MRFVNGFFNCKTICLVNETARLCALLEKQHEILPIIIMTQNLDLCMIRESCMGHSDVAVWFSKG